MAYVSELSYYQELAALMNAHPEDYEILGEVDLNLGLVMTGQAADLRVRLQFEGLGCTEVSALDEGGEHSCDCWLEGDLEAWGEMFDDIHVNGMATGRKTVNSLTLLGDRIDIRANDPLGKDLFFRFNQTVQQFLDGAAELEQSVV